MRGSGGCAGSRLGRSRGGRAWLRWWGAACTTWRRRTRRGTWRIRARSWPPGTVFLLYLILYAAGQFVLFYWRDNAIVALDLKQAQLTSLAVLAVSLPALLYRLRRATGTGRTAAQALDGATPAAGDGSTA